MLTILFRSGCRLTREPQGVRFELKHLEPSSLLVQEYTAALMRVTLSVFWGSTGEMVFIISEMESGGFRWGTADETS